MVNIQVNKNQQDEFSVELFYDDDNQVRIRLQSGEIIEEDEPDICWYVVSPTPEIVDTVARFYQRVMWRSEGVEPKPMPRDSETGLTLPGVLSEQAVKAAEGQLWRACGSIECDEQFVFKTERYL